MFWFFRVNWKMPFDIIYSHFVTYFVVLVITSIRTTSERKRTKIPICTCPKRNRILNIYYRVFFSSSHSHLYAFMQNTRNRQTNRWTVRVGGAWPRPRAKVNTRRPRGTGPKTFFLARKIRSRFVVLARCTAYDFSRPPDIYRWKTAKTEKRDTESSRHDGRKKVRPCHVPCYHHGQEENRKSLITRVYNIYIITIIINLFK